MNKLNPSTFNFHGANPEKYRGLDSQLWALWHRDYGELKTCLHQLNETLDDGDIFNLLPIDMVKFKKIEDKKALYINQLSKLNDLYLSLNNQIFALN